MNITVVSPGLLTTVQDKGRFGYMESGFSPSGAMDMRSLRIANILVGNNPGDGALEMTMMGGTFKFDCECVVSITGADMGAVRNGDEEVPMYKALQMKKGDTLKFGVAKDGMRTYLAVSGSFDLPLVMGSMSTNMKISAGGFKGRKLQANDEIPLRFESDLDLTGRRAYKNEEKYTKEVSVRVVLGPQDSYFTQKGIDTFLGQAYSVTDKSDRMGIRLDGEKIESKNGVDIISDGISTGAVQIPASGTPIIMMADRQTTGGYAKIATVITADLPKVAQVKPGTKIRFVKISSDDAAKEYKKFENEFKLLDYSMMFER